jgi:DNA-binding NarL/FixJ family response regulator
MALRKPLPVAVFISANTDMVERALVDLSRIGIALIEQPSDVEQLRTFGASPSEDSIRARAATVAAIAASGLSERQVDVLELMAEGLTNREIGRRLYVSEMTVKTHAAAMFKRLGANGREMAVAAGYRHGILGGAR